MDDVNTAHDPADRDSNRNAHWQREISIKQREISYVHVKDPTTETKNFP